MIDEDQRAARLASSRRRLLAGAGAVAGLGLAGGLGFAGGAALEGKPAVTPPPAPASPAVKLLVPSGDTSGATDHQSIQQILIPTPYNNWGQNTVVLLGSGVFYIHRTITFMAHQQAIRGQGQNITAIVAADDFTATTSTGPARATAFETPTETAMIYTGSGNQFLVVDGLTVNGPAASSGNRLALGGGDQLNGLQQTGGSIFCQFTNLHFQGINGWPLIFDGRGGNNANTLIENVRADDCAAVCYLQGNQGGYRGSATLMNVTGSTMKPPRGVMAEVPAAFVVRDYEDLLAWSATPSLVEGACASCFFYAIDTGDTILLRDAEPSDAAATGARSPSDIGFYGGIAEADDGKQSGIRITGGASQITINDLKLAYNTNHGISVEGTGDEIRLHNCQFQNNGTAGSTDGTAYYDLNWTGSSSGVVRDCTFNTTIKPVGTPGVAASVNFGDAPAAASGAVVDFAGCQFPQSGVTGPMFRDLPNTTTVRNCPPYNPVGELAVRVPPTGGSTAPLSHDAAFYITASSSASCTATVTGSTLTIPPGALVPIFVPAGNPLKLAYDKPPTWKVNGH
jgi:hypothetical protein